MERIKGSTALILLMMMGLGLGISNNWDCSSYASPQVFRLHLDVENFGVGSLQGSWIP